jgi:eukaryotic-like serine/threonine-protein kinase
MSNNIIGQVFLNQFRVEAFMAAGGMGAVYRVWDLKRNVPLAMKVLHADLADDPSIFKRFKREANALKKLAHPNIVPFYGLFDTPEMAFLLERFVDGPSLSELLRKRKGQPMPVHEVLIYLKGLCAALGYAHANGVVHCDVKPGNVMMDRGGTIYLTDFGIARHSESATTSMGGAGTPAYMAPEQIRLQPVSAATDVYALGVMLFEMLCGRRPFIGSEAGTEKGGLTSNERIRYGHLNVAPPDPCSLNPELSPSLSAVILKALSKRPEERFASTQALFSAACAAAGAVPERVAERISLQGFPAEAAANTTSSQSLNQGPIIAPRQAQAPGGRKPGMGILWGIGSAFVILVVLAVGILSRPGLKPASLPTLVPTVPFDAPTVPPAMETQPPSPLPATEIPTALPTATALPPPSSTPDSAQSSPVDGMRQVLVPAGTFTMGSSQSPYPDEKPEHTVSLDGFWIDQTEVTNGMFTQFVNETGYRTDLEKMGVAYTWNGGGWDSVDGGSWQHPFERSSSIQGRQDYPVIQVSWNDAAAYCNWAGRRLPTEAEWEKAARGPDGNLYPWGNDPPTKKLANYDSKIGDLSPVGSFPAGSSPYGALDMAGNIYEWVADWYGNAYYSASPPANPTGPASGTHKVMRGGSWQLGANRLVGYEREVSQPEYGNSNLGFRCAQTANR